jgi:predicted dithiol-disulfide oxidoreductase (DUF899 family)
MTDHKVVSRAEWQAARDELLRREKEHTRAGDELARQRRELPWVAISKEYVFDTEGGPRPLVGLFDGRSQLMVYHFLFGPSYEAGCPVNSSMADGLLPHLHARDVTLLLVSRAPLAKLQAYRERMGWRIPWVSAANTDFNYDIGASYPPSRSPGGAWTPPACRRSWRSTRLRPAPTSTAFCRKHRRSASSPARTAPSTRPTPPRRAGWSSS